MKLFYGDLRGDGPHRLFGPVPDGAVHVMPDGRAFPDRRVCWCTGMRLHRPRKTATGVERQWSSTVEHIVPLSWIGSGLVALTKEQMATNIVPVAHGLNGLLGNKPVFLKCEFRTALLEALAGRTTPRDDDRERARRNWAAVRARHGVGHDLMSRFAAPGWAAERPDLFERERAFLAGAGIRLSAAGADRGAVAPAP